MEQQSLSRVWNKQFVTINALKNDEKEALWHEGFM